MGQSPGVREEELPEEAVRTPGPHTPQRKPTEMCTHTHTHTHTRKGILAAELEKCQPVTGGRGHH